MSDDFTDVNVQQMPTQDWMEIVDAAEIEGVSVANYIILIHKSYQLLRASSMARRDAIENDT